jgi:hypothetical protein
VSFALSGVHVGNAAVNLVASVLCNKKIFGLIGWPFVYYIFGIYIIKVINIYFLYVLFLTFKEYSVLFGQLFFGLFMKTRLKIINLLGKMSKNIY